MGFFDAFTSRTQEVVRKSYRNATGRNYDRDFRDYKDQYAYKMDYEIECAWNRLREDRSMKTLPERMAIRSILKERSIDFDDY